MLLRRAWNSACRHRYCLSDREERSLGPPPKSLRHPSCALSRFYPQVLMPFYFPQLCNLTPRPILFSYSLIQFTFDNQIYDSFTKSTDSIESFCELLKQGRLADSSSCISVSRACIWVSSIRHPL